MTREEAIKIIKEFINGTCLHTVDQEALETLIPELKESEDERIRKEIVDHFERVKEQAIRDYQEDTDEIVASCNEKIAYLENLEDKKPATIEQVSEKFLSSDTLKKAKENKYIRAQLFWELMHNGIITEVDYLYLTDDKRKPWTVVTLVKPLVEEYQKAYKNGFDASEQLKHFGM